MIIRALAIAAILSLALPAAAQPAWKPPRTEHGQPDLQGAWTNATLTNLERDAKYGDRLVMTPEEAAAIEQTEARDMAAANRPSDPALRTEDLPHECGRGFTGVNCGYNSFWIDPGTQVIRLNGQTRTSIIVDPPNGRIPALTEAARARMQQRFAGRRGRGSDDPEGRSLGERCILSFGSSAGPPMLPLLYNNTYEIVQTKDAVAILVEMVHDVRIIRLGGEHAPSAIRQWMGDSVGRWEGDTLVVETVGLRPEQGFRGASPDLKVIERFTRVSPTQIHYRFTVDDPATFTQAWSGELAMNATRGPVYEYACHEGNYSLPGILAGARAEEAEAAKAAASATGRK